jgi:transposase
MEDEVRPRKPYPTYVRDDEWAFVAPYLSLMTQDAPQRPHDLREVCNALRWLVHTGAPWRYLPGDPPPWPAVYQQTRRWLEAGCFADMPHDLRVLLRWTGDEPMTRARSFWTVLRGNRVPRVAREPAEMATSAARGPRSPSPSIPSGICWPCG